MVQCIADKDHVEIVFWKKLPKLFDITIPWWNIDNNIENHWIFVSAKCRLSKWSHAEIAGQQLSSSDDFKSQISVKESRTPKGKIDMNRMKNITNLNKMNVITA